MGWSRPDKIRDFIHRDNKKRWRRHRTLYQQKPEQIPPISRPAKVVQMFDTLTEQGWTFRFKIDVLSPRGFRYSAEGDTAIEAFLKAFGQWQKRVSFRCTEGARGRCGGVPSNSPTAVRPSDCYADSTAAGKTLQKSPNGTLYPHKATVRRPSHFGVDRFEIESSTVVAAFIPAHLSEAAQRWQIAGGRRMTDALTNRRLVLVCEKCMEAVRSLNDDCKCTRRVA